MTYRTQLAKQAGKAVLGIVAPLVTQQAVDRATKFARGAAEQRGQLRECGGAIYRHLDKVRVIGETALTLDDDSPSEVRQPLAAEAAALRDSLHAQMADFRLLAAARKLVVLDVAQAALVESDRLVTELRRWSLRTRDASPTEALRHAVQSLAASQSALLSCLGQPRRMGRKQKAKRDLPDEPGTAGTDDTGNES
jgi:hypothetical protein